MIRSGTGPKGAIRAETVTRTCSSPTSTTVVAPSGAARGDPTGVVEALVARSAPEGATTAVEVGAEEVRVTVSARIAPLGPVPLRITVSADAVALREPGEAG